MDSQLSSHPYAKFIHAENQDILWSLFQKSRPWSQAEDQDAVFKREMREYYTERLISSGKPCITVRDLFEINRDALAHLLSQRSITPRLRNTDMDLIYAVDVFQSAVNVSEDKKRMEDAQRNKFTNYSSDYHKLLARPGPNIENINHVSSPTDDKIKNMDELMERQIQARKEDETRIAALFKPVKPQSLKIDFGSEKTVSWDPAIEVVNI